MSSDSVEVLAKLVRTGLWSQPANLLSHKRLVVDVDSLVTYIYRRCVSDHIQAARGANANRTLDLNSATLVNYVHYADYVAQFLDYFTANQIELHLVYQGKFMEAPLFGLLAAQFTRNVQKVSEAIATIEENQRRGPTSISDAPKHLSRPNLALNIFKLVVNCRRCTVTAHQSFYSSYPVMAKLARDLRCPVITNNGDFILMDVRAGFALVDELWAQVIGPAKRANARKSGAAKPASEGRVCFHHSILFLRQHPGLTNQLAVRLYPLTSIDFVVAHSASLRKLAVYNETYKESDFKVGGYKKVGSAPDKTAFRLHHKRAERLELASGFLCGKSTFQLGSLIRGEATRASSSFDDDFNNILQNFAVAFGFKERLRFVLKYLSESAQIEYIEKALVRRECSADFLLDLVCCSIGHLASVNYNRFMQFEDLATKASAHSLLDRAKSALMSSFSRNKSRRSEHSMSLSRKQPETATRYSAAKLTVIDRRGAELVERTIDTALDDAGLATLSDKLQLRSLASNGATRGDKIHFLNQVFRSSDLTKLDANLERISRKFIASEQTRVELAITSALFRFAASEAGAGDDYFKRTYTKLADSFRFALLNQFLLADELASGRKHKELAPLVDLVERRGYREVASQPAAGNSAPSSKLIRHLIELLGASLEAYTELNALLGYPSPALNLHLHHNPVLLYNLTLCLSGQPNNKALITR